jgi:hypothetical protein
VQRGSTSHELTHIILREGPVKTSVGMKVRKDGVMSRCAVLILAMVQLLLHAACGGSSAASTPTQPSASTQAVVPPASLRTPISGQPGAQLSLTGCDAQAIAAAAAMGLGTISCPTFSGGVENIGTGCAVNVRGTTVMLNGPTPVGSAAWTYANTVRPGELITYTGGPITIVTTGWPCCSYHTTVSWDNDACQ